jgi:PPIC-type peptidyl-prolyl cis-trans isomerase-like protein
LTDPLAPEGVTTVLAATLSHWFRIARRSGPHGRRRDLERQALGILVGELWIRGEAGEEGIHVTDAQVRAESWSAVARRYSEDDVSRRRGGLLRGLRRGTLEPRVDRAVFRARRGRLVGPVRTRFGYYVFEVVRVHPSQVVPPARERRIIRRRLVARAEKDAFVRFAREFTARWRARTVCAPAYTWDPDCSNHDGTPVDARTRK